MAYKREDLEKQMRESASDYVGCKPEELNLDKKLRDEYGITSIEATELILEIEDRYKIRIPTEDALKILSTNDAIEYVIKHT